MADDRYADLARYNAERARGIVHSPEWRRRMERQQADFDAEQTRRLIREGFELSGEDGPGPQFWLRMDDPRDRRGIRPEFALRLLHWVLIAAAVLTVVIMVGAVVRFR